MDDELDPVTRAVLKTVADGGFVVGVRQTDGGYVAVAEGAGGEIREAWGGDPYSAAVELAQALGFDLRE